MASVQCLPFPFLTFHAEAAGFGRIGRIRLSTSAFKLTAGHGTRHHASSARYGRSVTQRHAPYQGPSKQGTVATSGGSFAYLKIFYIYIYYYIYYYITIYIARSARVKVLICYKSVFFVSKCVTEKERERESCRFAHTCQGGTTSPLKGCRTSRRLDFTPAQAQLAQVETFLCETMLGPAIPLILGEKPTSVYVYV